MAENANDAQGLAHSFIVLHGSPDSFTQPDWNADLAVAGSPATASDESAGHAGRACPTTGSIATASAASTLMNRRHIIAA